jgi:hypothetical protein
MALVALGKRFPGPVPPGAFASIQGHLGPDARGVTLFGSMSAADSQHIAALPREIHLGKGRVSALAVERKSASRGHDPACLAPDHEQRRKPTMAVEPVYVLVAGKPYKGQVAPSPGFGDGVEAVRLLEGAGLHEATNPGPEGMFFPPGTVLLARWDERSRHGATGERVLRLLDPT